MWLYKPGGVSTNQAVGSSNLSGRAILLFISTNYSAPLGRFFSWLANKAKNIHLIGQVLSLHAFPVYTASVIKWLTGFQKVSANEIRKKCY